MAAASTNKNNFRLPQKNIAPHRILYIIENVNTYIPLQLTAPKTTNDIREAAKSWTPPEHKKMRKHKQSKLEGHWETIKYMRSARHMTYGAIHKFFVEQGIVLSFPTFMHFVHRHRKRK